MTHSRLACGGMRIGRNATSLLCLATRDVTMIASVLIPPDFVCDGGDTLADGSIAPVNHIRIFLGQSGNLLNGSNIGNLRYDST
ncbi:MAG: hypothetical protein M2R45_04876 [Verrucomicrobia subdivision 3 bacterium]|nr:hypothetical protein [Limisphaerales bacterium]MCS1417518.1 hypothetical protein [Limisphaerales bacterium]